MQYGCDSCGHTKTAAQTAKEDVRQKAYTYAKENKKPVVLIKEGNQYIFVEYSYALSSGIPFEEIIHVNS